MWSDFWRFLTHLDAKLIRALWVSATLIVCVGLLFVVAKSEFGQGVLVWLETMMQAYAHSPWALVIVCLVFTLSAFFAAPQFVLIAACVVAFGPWLGFVYSWTATIVSASVTFYLGRLAGPWVFRRFGAESFSGISTFVGKNAFSASFMIRNIPSAPFIVVNMGFGASKAAFFGFILGCALGVLPKTALVAAFGHTFEALQKREPVQVALALLGLAVVWLGLVMGARFLIGTWQSSREA
jgi:uncharacterized membrane protein YdjX (TVP38/TMEM64 family)